MVSSSHEYSVIEKLVDAFGLSFFYVLGVHAGGDYQSGNGREHGNTGEGQFQTVRIFYACNLSRTQDRRKEFRKNPYRQTEREARTNHPSKENSQNHQRPGHIQWRFMNMHMMLVVALLGEEGQPDQPEHVEGSQNRGE